MNTSGAEAGFYLVVHMLQTGRLFMFLCCKFVGCVALVLMWLDWLWALFTLGYRCGILLGLDLLILGLTICP